mgnify:CR=1 FL=1
MFQNTLFETNTNNYFTYPYMYLGGGVAAGDFNNDGLEDLFFTGNMVPNKLYINKGNLEFEDISKTAGIEGDQRWYSGVTLIDINKDGYLDIYCSVAGENEPQNNVLYLNNQDNTFKEVAKDYGIDDNGYSMHSTFFDYDKDGDLDPIEKFFDDDLGARIPEGAVKHVVDGRQRVGRKAFDSRSHLFRKTSQERLGKQSRIAGSL